MMAMLLPVHAAVTLEWLADATATAAERTIGAAHTFLYLEEDDGTLAWRSPTSDLRRRSVQRVIDAAGSGVLDRKIDPSASATLGDALEGERPMIGSPSDVLGEIIGAERAEGAAAALGVDAVAVAPLCSAGERIGALLLFIVGEPDAERVRLFADHVACATVNLRQALAARTDGAGGGVVRTLFDSRKVLAELEREIMRAERFKRDVSICVIEATNMRLLRERFGAELTEALLERTGEELAAHSRDIDVIGQYKASGFAMVLSETSAEGVRQASRRLMAAAAEAGRDTNVPGLELHLAFGWATCPGDGKTEQALFAAAERRMYDPKTQVA
jgi:diguanylate cyclase (GGDEF)-like protein